MVVPDLGILIKWILFLKNEKKEIILKYKDLILSVGRTISYLGFLKYYFLIRG